MKIAHISDLHLMGSEKIPPHRLLGKRFSGWVNLKYRRHAVHKPRVAQAVAREIRRRDIDHVVITGDMTNLALESEFEAVRNYLEQDLALPPDRVSVVPGNHDAYTRGAHRSRRFQCYFGEYITSDLPNASGVPDVGRFPFVRLRGPVAIIGLTTAVPRVPLVASGFIGDAQRMALRALLNHEEVRKRTPVLLQHHPWTQPASRKKAFMQGLQDASEEYVILRKMSRGMLLHGHLHRRVQRTITTDSGELLEVGTTSASLLDPSEERMSGFNLYDVPDGGPNDDAPIGVSAFRFDPDNGDFIETTIPSGG